MCIDFGWTVTMVIVQKIQAESVNVCSTSFCFSWLENTAQLTQNGTYKIEPTCISNTQQSPLTFSLHSTFAVWTKNNKEQLTYEMLKHILYFIYHDGDLNLQNIISNYVSLVQEMVMYSKLQFWITLSYFFSSMLVTHHTTWAPSSSWRKHPLARAGTVEGRWKLCLKSRVEEGASWLRLGSDSGLTQGRRAPAVLPGGRGTGESKTL